ncbi:MAG: hypothetical protein H7832_06715 [Magnetococcus sp. DMHC-6]
MLFKLILSILVIAIIYFLGRIHANRPMPPPPPPRAPRSRGDKIALTIAFSFVLLTSSWFFYNNWQEEHQQVKIRVINVQSNQTTTYLAHKNALQNRSFITLDGRWVTLADIERMEVEEVK